MAEIKDFETYDMSMARVSRKAARRLSEETLDDRTRMEVEFLKEVTGGDMGKAQKIGDNIEKMHRCGIKVLK